MAQYFTNRFEDFATCSGEKCGAWTARYHTLTNWSVSDGNLIFSGGYGLDTTGLTWDAIDSDPNTDNVEVFFKYNSGVSSLADGRLIGVRASGVDEAPYQYAIVVTENSSYFRLYKNVGSDTGTAIATVSFSYSVNTVYCVRFRAHGTHLQARIWQDGTAEPVSWNIDVYDSDIAGPGWVGAFAYNAGQPQWILYELGVGTNGDPAPSAPVNKPHTGSKALYVSQRMLREPRLLAGLPPTGSVVSNPEYIDHEKSIWLIGTDAVLHGGKAFSYTNSTIPVAYNANCQSIALGGRDYIGAVNYGQGGISNTWLKESIPEFSAFCDLRILSSSAGVSPFIVGGSTGFTIKRLTSGFDTEIYFSAQKIESLSYYDAFDQNDRIIVAATFDGSTFHVFARNWDRGYYFEGSIAASDPGTNTAGYYTLGLTGFRTIGYGAYFTKRKTPLKKMRELCFDPYAWVKPA